MGCACRVGGRHIEKKKAHVIRARKGRVVASKSGETARDRVPKVTGNVFYMLHNLHFSGRQKAGAAQRLTSDNRSLQRASR